MVMEHLPAGVAPKVRVGAVAGVEAAAPKPNDGAEPAAGAPKAGVAVEERFGS